jgi:hypothetical protein
MGNPKNLLWGSSIPVAADHSPEHVLMSMHSGGLYTRPFFLRFLFFSVILGALFVACS